jgi:hypothetical protein
MVDISVEITALILTYLLNLPFGYWREKTKKLSKEWFVAIHSPVPVIFLIRIIAEVPLTHIPLFVLTFFLGQLSGGRIRGSLRRYEPLTKCLVLDLFRVAKTSIAGSSN